MSAASSSSHAAPEAIATARLAQTIAARLDRYACTSASAPAFAVRNAGSAMRKRNKTIPATIALEAKWRVRAPVSASNTGASQDFHVRGALADMEAERAFRRVRID